MAARNVNLVLEQGVDFQAVFTIRNNNNSPLNLTGYTGISSIRKSPTSSTAYPLTLSFPDLLNGKVAVSMGHTATGTMEGGRYVYDVELIDGAGRISRIIEGTVTITPNVTR